MQRIALILIFLVCLFHISGVSASAGLFDGLFKDTLVTIDGKDYSVDDFRTWWKFYQEPDIPFPQTPQPYVDWLLLSQEGKRMELDSTPDFQRKTRIFLQSRALPMLKFEEVDSRVEVTDSEIKKRYEEEYTPRYLVQRLEFKDEEGAMAAWGKISEGKLTVEDLLSQSPEEGGPVSKNENGLRAPAIDPGWAAIFGEMEAGGVVDPSRHAKGRALYYLQEKDDGDEEDFAQVSEEIKKDLWREKQAALTNDLLERLRKKYDVQVVEERLTPLSISAPDEAFTEAPVITTNRQNVSEKDFIAIIRRVMATRAPLAHADVDVELARELKAEAVANIVAQSVTNWESLDRHYEEKEPFKSSYEFNYDHRVVLALEQRLFLQDATVTDDEIKQHYHENINQFTKPEVVQLYMVDAIQGPVEKMWADIAGGKSFSETVEESLGHSPQIQQVPTNHLDPEVKKVVEKLGNGETSQVFDAQDTRVMVHLVRRDPETPLPFDRVKDQIRSRLTKEKMQKIRSEYLDRIKAGMDIQVNERKWNVLRKELGGA